MGERLSWPGWLTYSRRITHINGHPSATGRAQDRESLSARDRRSTAVPRNQHDITSKQLFSYHSSKDRKLSWPEQYGAG